MGADKSVDENRISTLDREELSPVVRSAMTSTMLDTLGTLFLLGLSLFFLAAGTRSLLATTTVGTIFGVVWLSLSLWLAAAAFDMVPPFRE